MTLVRDAGLTVANPVIGGFHPDPSVCRVGDDYYLATSSFEYVPGIPIHHSRDLVHWRQIGNVIDRPNQLPFPDTLPASHGIWAPTLRHHAGRFWVATHAMGAGGNLILTTDDPAGPWSDPVFVDVQGIDPDLAWDVDGTCWFATSGTRVSRIDPERGVVLEGPIPAWPGSGGAYPEAPHLYRLGAWWYLLIAEGGTERGHGVTVARSRSPRGPWEPGPANPILSHRSSARPIQSVGHADLVDAPDGTWWMVLLGTRPRGSSPGFHVLGRETFLARVRWTDGWPVVDEVAPRIPAPSTWRGAESDPSWRDDFDDATGLEPGYVTPRARAVGSWSLVERPGWLTLIATGASLDHPSATWIGRRQAAPEWVVETCVEVEADGRAGLSIRIDEAHHYDLEVADGAVAVNVRIGPVQQVVASRPARPGPVPLRIELRDVGASGGTGPDLVTFKTSADDPPLAVLDGRYVSTEVATGFTGRVIGMYATRGTAGFDWYRSGALAAG